MPRQRPTSRPGNQVRFKRRRGTDHGVSDGFLPHFHQRGVGDCCSKFA
jgi:hypothetical protein